ncbi:MAG: IucA/IucC family protein [Mycobacteriales bacterium]
MTAVETIRTAPVTGSHSPAEQDMLAALGAERPALAAAYPAALAPARAGVLARLWGALWREPLPGIAARWVRASTGEAVVMLPDGRRLTAPAHTTGPFATVPASWAVIEHGRTVTALHHPVALLDALRLSGPAADRLRAELDDSVAALALAYTAAALRQATGATGANGGDTEPTTLVGYEQSVLDGHPLHPCCRTRTGMSAADLLAYAPEHHPVVRLKLLAVPRDRWHATGRWDDVLGLPAPAGHALLPVHPWQLAHLDRLGELPPGLSVAGELPADPLLSLRTFALRDRPQHLKTAIDVQMTSAVRRVSPAAVRNGPAVSGLLATLVAAEDGFAGTFAVLAEPAAGAVLVGGEPSARLAAVLRDPPRARPGERVMPAAALPDHLRRRPPADPAGWMRAYALLTARPFLTLLARWGVALEAHGQNTLAVLHDGRPARVLYRDLGGVRISPARLERVGVPCPPLAGDLACDDGDELVAKLLASLVSTHWWSVVTALAAATGCPAGALWGQVAAACRAVLDGLASDDGAGDGAVAAALFADHLPVKAMTAMRLATDPHADIWTTVPNPLKDPR